MMRGWSGACGVARRPGLPASTVRRMESTQQAFTRLRAVIEHLIGPEGCPWDRRQTVATLAPFLVEEAWELVDAAACGDREGMREELGDVLMLVMLMGAIGERDGGPDLAAAADGVRRKLIRRHPHVFDRCRVKDAEEVQANWDAIKRSEDRNVPDDGLPALPAALPALMGAFRLGKAAARQGFDWPDLGGPMAKISEEWAELQRAVALGEKNGTAHEVGDLLFAVTSMCRFLAMDPEHALRTACGRFRRRFGYVRRHGGEAVRNDPAAMERLWQQAKQEENG